jgi:hypothetical protein
MEYLLDLYFYMLREYKIRLMSALKINVRVLQHHLLLCIKVTVVYS